jgi:hypothetical protein
MPLVMDLARFKTILYRAILTTSTLMVIKLYLKIQGQKLKNLKPLARNDLT